VAEEPRPRARRLPRAPVPVVPPPEVTHVAEEPPAESLGLDRVAPGAVPRLTRRSRNLQAWASVVLALLCALVGMWWGWRVNQAPSLEPQVHQEDLTLVVAKPFEIDPTIVVRHAIPGVPKEPQDALMILRAGHRFQGWELSCPSWPKDLLFPSGGIKPSETRVWLKQVPPVVCSVHLSSPQATPPKTITAGDQLACHMSSGTQFLCMYPDGSFR
jgi:hypothetical protein